MKPILLTAIILGATAAVTPAASVPRQASELTWKTPDGKTGSLSSLKGKVVVLEVLSTTCSHCQDTAAMLSRMMADFGSKGLQVVGVAINDDANIPDFQSRFAQRFPVGKGDRDAALGFLQQSLMRSFYFPGLVFIDRSGVVQSQYTGTDAFVQSNQERNIRTEIQKLLATPATTPAKTSSAIKRKAS